MLSYPQGIFSVEAAPFSETTVILKQVKDALQHRDCTNCTVITNNGCDDCGLL